MIDDYATTTRPVIEDNDNDDDGGGGGDVVVSFCAQPRVPVARARDKGARAHRRLKFVARRGSS